jgi:hypothetical protein
MPIKDRNLSVGTKLIGKYHKQDYSVEVIQGENGKLLYRLQDGREFKSPSGAGMAVTGHSCDGWKFWSVETTEDTPVAVIETPASPKKKIIFRAPNQKSVPAGQTRWYCKDCGESFLADMGTIPGTCPQGHKA